jgi:hypothetical protein
LEKGILVSKPVIEARYDLLLDCHGTFYRAQVKYADGTASKSANAVPLNLQKQCRGNGKTKVYTRDEVDVILVYVPKIDKVLWIGPEIFHGKSTIQIRLSPPKKKQTGKNLHLAEMLVW